MRTFIEESIVFINEKGEEKKFLQGNEVIIYTFEGCFLKGFINTWNESNETLLLEIAGVLNIIHIFFEAISDIKMVE